ncbi:hypothetical protein HanXRQr2_Chr13g0566291 [Helianthus annuus]|uniref:Uncharacterized protein n=1 Tax=Helianthus annuus TaxID=4232 RepID=A0A9K3H8G3_HELAN|nr:hypothetical protein HanXRQr2_Chr13g0566291 [Helianthus annuus]KAJ0478875.1 hypothetical protein HanHA300_Chr13g0504691 [Helianthus annuus]KAJ0496132.1 hypothetical protein HanHA89_Chr13g0496251 [Helianthus annuus]KAJ0847436.1 hypothetical protein HanPSC8_Chr13g0545311 [Helianthus annuus]
MHDQRCGSGHWRLRKHDFRVCGEIGLYELVGFCVNKIRVCACKVDLGKNVC